MSLEYKKGEKNTEERRCPLYQKKIVLNFKFIEKNLICTQPNNILYWKTKIFWKSQKMALQNLSDIKCHICLFQYSQTRLKLRIWECNVYDEPISKVP